MISEKEKIRCFVRFLKEEEIYHYFKGVCFYDFLSYLSKPHGYNIYYKNWFSDLVNHWKGGFDVKYGFKNWFEFEEWYSFKWMVYIYYNKLDNDIIKSLNAYHANLNRSKYKNLSLMNKKKLKMLNKIHKREYFFNDD